MNSKRLKGLCLLFVIALFGGTTATFTGAPSTDAAGTEKLLALIQEDATGTKATEESTASVEQTKEAATAQFATSVGQTGTDGQTKTTVPVPRIETRTAVMSTLAPPGYNKSCETCDVIRIPDHSTVWNINGSICKVEDKYHSTFAIQDQRNPSQTKNYASESTRQLDCSTVVNLLRNSLAAMLSSRPTPMPSDIPPNARKRREADEATTSEPPQLSIFDVLGVLNNTIPNFTDISSETSQTKNYARESTRQLDCSTVGLREMLAKKRSSIPMPSTSSTLIPSTTRTTTTLGILSTHVISAEDEEDTGVATTEEVPGATTAAGDQSTAEDSTSATGVETVTSVAQETQETSAGETGASTGTEGLGIERATGESTPGGTVIVEIATSAGELSTAGTGALQTGSDKTGTSLLESSTGGAEDGATATVTGAPSTDTTGILGIIKEDTTGTTATEEGTASVEQTKEATTAKYTTYVGHASTERQAATPTEQIESCTKCDDTRVTDPSTVWTYSVSICENEHEGKYRATYVVQKQTTGETRNRTRDLPRKQTCSTVVTALRNMLVAMISRMPLPSPMPSQGTPPPNRKRRQADEVTTTGPFTLTPPTDLSFDALFKAGEDAIKSITNISSETQPIAMEEAREGPAAVSNPIPDAEMIQDEAPMQERENPSVTPNGGGQHISKADEDNGWVVPLDELSKAEKEKPEVENTRL